MLKAPRAWCFWSTTVLPPGTIAVLQCPNSAILCRKWQAKKCFQDKGAKKFRTQSKFYLYQIYICLYLKMLKKWKWRNIRPSMVTHTRNACSALSPFTVHTHSSEHTPGAVGSHLCCGKCGSSWGFGALLKGTSGVVLRWRERWIFTPPTYIPADSLTIRPRLPVDFPHKKSLWAKLQNMCMTKSLSFPHSPQQLCINAFPSPVPAPNILCLCLKNKQWLPKMSNFCTHWAVFTWPCSHPGQNYRVEQSSKDH